MAVLTWCLDRLGLWFLFYLINRARLTIPILTFCVSIVLLVPSRVVAEELAELDRIAADLLEAASNEQRRPGQKARPERAAMLG